MGTSRLRTPSGARLNRGTPKASRSPQWRRRKNLEGRKKFQGVDEKFSREWSRWLTGSYPLAAWPQGGHGSATRASSGRLPLPRRRLLGGRLLRLLLAGDRHQHRTASLSVCLLNSLPRETPPSPKRNSGLKICCARLGMVSIRSLRSGQNCARQSQFLRLRPQEWCGGGLVVRCGGAERWYGTLAPAQPLPRPRTRPGPR